MSIKPLSVNERGLALILIPQQIKTLLDRRIVARVERAENGTVDVFVDGDQWSYPTYEQAHIFLAGCIVGSDEETPMPSPACTEDARGICTNPLHEHPSEPDMVYYLLQRHDVDGPAWIADLNGSTVGGFECDDDSVSPLEFPDRGFAVLVRDEMRQRRDAAGLAGEFSLHIYRVEVRLDGEGNPIRTYARSDS